MPPLAIRQIYSYIIDVRRKAGVLLPLELSILETGLDLRRLGVPEYHGFLIAKEIQAREGARLLTAHGTLYKALERMEKAGLLTSHWEDPLVAADQRRPRRRLYQVTPAGEKALAESPPFRAGSKVRLEPGTRFHESRHCWMDTARRRMVGFPFYTSGLPADIRDRRRAEIQSDLWEQRLAFSQDCRTNGSIALVALDRAVRGTLADLV